MKAILLRTTSGSARSSPSLTIGSPRSHSHGPDHAVSISFSGRSSTPSPRSALHCEMKEGGPIPTVFRRSLSDSNLIRSEVESSDQFRAFHRLRSRSIPASIAEEDTLSDKTVRAVDYYDDGGELMLTWKSFEVEISDRVSAFTEEGFESSGGGIGKGRKAGGGGGDGRGESTGGNADWREVGAYYQKMLKTDPGNPLLLRNYAKFLHEVLKDFKGAEEYYGRAILASPEDGEVMSLYGQLIWEVERDKQRAKSYFDQAIEAASDNCFVLGSYAHFLWDATEDDEEDGAQGAGIRVEEISASFVQAC